MLTQADVIEQMAEREAIADVDGLSQTELTVLAITAGSTPDDEQPTALWGVKKDVERAGLTNIGFSLGLRRLKRKGLVAICEMADGNSYETYEGLSVTIKGWEWIENNESKFILHTSPTKKPAPNFSDMDDEIPF